MPVQKQESPKHYFEGQWVRTDYVEAIKATRSPYKSKNKLDGLATIIIDTGAITGDSLIANASWNNHEGFAFTLYFDEQRGATSFGTDLPDYDDSLGCYALGYKAINADTILVLYHINRSHVLTDSATYVKAKQSKTTDPTWPIQYMVNKFVFAGAYTVYDSLGNKQDASMDNDGNTNGIADYTSYYIATDFNGGPEAVDHMMLASGSNEDDRKSRIFSFIATPDTIKLYAMMQDTDTITPGMHPLYILKRK